MTERADRAGWKPSLVLFDLDDTLCDHDTSLRLRLRRAFATAVEGLPGIDLEALVAASVARAVGGTEHFGALLASFGVTDPARVERAVETYASDRYYGLKLFDEALDVIEAIRREARVGMITNGPSRIQRDKVLRLEIGELFPFILVSEEEGIAKPDPAIFRRALELGRARPEDAVYIGDNPDADVGGARAAGIRSVWVNRAGRPWPGGPRPDYEVADLRGLLPLFGFGAAG